MLNKCIFCGCDTTNCKSVEHIIPESLGNSELVLPKGFVCDKCNNYFSSSFESKVLNSNYFSYIRCYNFIKTKKGHYTDSTVYFDNEICPIDIIEHENHVPAIFIGVSPEIACQLLNEMKTPFIYSICPDFDNENIDFYSFSRFLYKIAIESLFRTLKEHYEEECYITFTNLLVDKIKFVRTGNVKGEYLPFDVIKANGCEIFNPGSAQSHLWFYLKNKDLYFHIEYIEQIFELKLIDNFLDYVKLD